MAFLDKHKAIETHATLLMVLSLLVVTIGGIVQIVPLFYLENTIEDVEGVRPYTPLELAGRNVYVREGCYLCHSQMIRPLRDEVERYGHYSLAAESMYDHPFVWGSKRTGPDLHREGGKYPDAWHYNHMDDPRSTSPGSIMPRYSWLLTQKIDTNAMPPRIAALRKVGVPYPTGYENGDAQKDLAKQADAIVVGLKVGSVDSKPDREIIALKPQLEALAPRLATVNVPERSRSPISVPTPCSV